LNQAVERATKQIGTSRPPLQLGELPEPEDVFNKPKIRFKEILTAVLGPSMIALGVSIGSGEWLLGPMAVGKWGFIGLGWIILVSAVLQTLYNIENARFTLATGEVPVVAFSRTPPGAKLWAPFTVIVIFMAWIWGGWTAAAGQSLFALFAGRLNRPDELEVVRILGILLLFLAFGLFLFGKKISQTLETFNKVTVFIILFSIIVIAVIVAPPSLWAHGFGSLFIFKLPPKGIDIDLLGAIAGYTGFASCMNFLLINYYRDKGYGMGHRVGYIAGLIGGKPHELLASGVTFEENPRNSRLWKRWFRFMLLDQWSVFFIGAIIGMIVPSILVASLARTPGASIPDKANMPVYAASELRRCFEGTPGQLFFCFTLLIGWLTLFKTQCTILEMLVRNPTDLAFSMSKRFREWVKGDPRRFYYPLAVILIALIAVINHLTLPTNLLIISANMANFGALVFPFLLIYLNRQLPKPARMSWKGTVVLTLNAIFFGFFFLNFIWSQLFHAPLVKF
jgi:hypothetical protein